MEKECLYCGIIFKSKGLCPAVFRVRKFCNRKCAARYRGAPPGFTFKGRRQKRESMRILGQKRLGENNPMWKGDKVGCGALHDWIKPRKPKPPLCEKCKMVPPFDLASTNDSYTRNLDDWRWLCRKCHMTLDGRLKNWLNGMSPKVMRGEDGRFARKPEEEN